MGIRNEKKCYIAFIILKLPLCERIPLAIITTHQNTVLGLSASLSSIDIPCWYCSFKQSDADSDLINLCSHLNFHPSVCLAPISQGFPVQSPQENKTLTSCFVEQRAGHWVVQSCGGVCWGCRYSCFSDGQWPSSWLCSTYFPSRGARHQFLSFVGKLWGGQVWDSTQKMRSYFCLPLKHVSSSGSSDSASTHLSSFRRHRYGTI